MAKNVAKSGIFGGKNEQKRGGSGGGPKNRQILHTGGGNLGGVFLGGSRKTGVIKHEVL